VVRKAVKDSDGGELPSPPGFIALRDGKDFSHPRFKAIKTRWADIFSKLSSAGIDKSDIVVAWTL